MRKIFLTFLLCFTFSVSGQIQGPPQPGSVALFHVLNPMKEAQPDTYWDLAWHAKTASMGDGKSAFILAEAYEQGKYTQKNLKKALHYYKLAAQNGVWEACMKLGTIYTEGKWVVPDPDQAVFWYQLAADHNFTPALLKLSDLYEQQGNLPKAVAYLEKAMRLMFPDTADLTTVSPKLRELKNALS